MACPPPLGLSRRQLCSPAGSSAGNPSRGESLEGERNAGHCWDRVSRQENARKGTWVMIVLNVDIAGNGTTGARRQEMNPINFSDVSCFTGQLQRRERLDLGLLGSPCPPPAAGRGVEHAPPVPWDEPAPLEMVPVQ